MEYKGYNITSDGTFGQKVIKSIGPGTIPQLLTGSFTTVAEAEKAIDRYIGAKETEEARLQAVRDVKPTPPKLKRPAKKE